MQAGDSRDAAQDQSDCDDNASTAADSPARVSPAAVQAAVCSALKWLVVNEEICKAFAEDDGVRTALQVLCCCLISCETVPAIGPGVCWHLGGALPNAVLFLSRPVSANLITAMLPYITGVALSQHLGMNSTCHCAYCS